METGIYVRVSTEEQVQEGYSIRAQEQKLKDYARIKDWSIYKIYTDEGISGKNIKDRPAVNEMIADIKEGKVKNVVVFKIDRLTRNTIDLIQLVDLFNTYDCAFNSLMESIDTQTSSGRMFLKIIGIFAEFERENIVERTKLGFERKAKEGDSVSSYVTSYGYDRKNGEKVQTINPKEAVFVKEIFDMFVNQNISVTGIAKRLNIRKIPTKLGNTWTPKTVKDILTNCNYIGKVRYSILDEKRYFEAEGKHEPIINKELYEEAQKAIARNPKICFTKNPRKENYYCGFLVCGKCSAKLVSHVTKRKRVNGSTYLKIDYRCVKQRIGACDACHMNHNKVEKAFISYFDNIQDLVFDNEFQHVEQDQMKKKAFGLKSEYKIQINRLEKKEKEIMSLYVNCDIEFDNFRHIKELIDKDKALLINEIKMLENQLSNETTIKKEDIIIGLKENWSLLNDVEKRQFLLKFVNKIEIVNRKQGKQYSVEINNIEFNCS